MPKSLVAVLALWSVTNVIVLAGFLYGDAYWERSWPPRSVFSVNYYGRIAKDGYTYRDDKPSSVAFFPAYPLAVRYLSRGLGIPTEWALFAVANGCFLAAVLAMRAYSAATGRTAGETFWSVAAIAVLPIGLFFRAPYSESLFAMMAAIVLLGIRKQCPLAAISLLVGLATATRPVGVALLGPWCLAIYDRAPSRRSALGTMVVHLPLATWGIAAYMAYQQVAFGNCLAFAQTQENWTLRGTPPVGVGEKLLALGSWEPVWSVYLPNSAGYWRRQQGEENAWLNLQFANPIYFVAAVVLCALGFWRRWLDRSETVLTALLLAIPYVTRGYEMCMNSQARFVSVALPLYFVVGRLFDRLPRPVTCGICLAAAVQMFLYSALFAAGYPIY